MLITQLFIWCTSESQNNEKFIITWYVLSGWVCDTWYWFKGFVGTYAFAEAVLDAAVNDVPLELT